MIPTTVGAAIADQARALHHQGEPHLRPGVRRSCKQGNGDPEPDPVRSRRHAEPARAGRAVRAARQPLLQRRGVAGRPSLDDFGVRDRLHAARLDAELLEARRARSPATASPSSRRPTSGSCAAARPEGDDVRHGQPPRRRRGPQHAIRAAEPGSQVEQRPAGERAAHRATTCAPIASSKSSRRWTGRARSRISCSCRSARITPRDHARRAYTPKAQVASNDVARRQDRRSDHEEPASGRSSRSSSSKTMRRTDPITWIRTAPPAWSSAPT